MGGDNASDDASRTQGGRGEDGGRRRRTEAEDDDEQGHLGGHRSNDGCRLQRGRTRPHGGSRRCGPKGPEAREVRGDGVVLQSAITSNLFFGPSCVRARMTHNAARDRGQIPTDHHPKAIGTFPKALE